LPKNIFCDNLKFKFKNPIKKEGKMAKKRRRTAKPGFLTKIRKKIRQSYHGTDPRAGRVDLRSQKNNW